MGGEVVAAALVFSAVALLELAVSTEPLVAQRPGSDRLTRPWAWRPPGRILRRRRAQPDLVQSQLADAMTAIAAGSRSGLSLVQSLAMAGEQVGDSIGASLRGISDRVRLGTSLEEALDGWRVAAAIPDVRLAAAVLGLHRRTGGEVAPVLEGLARTLRERRAVGREIRSLTAQARLSGAILGLLPVGFFAFLWVTSRRDMTVALGSSLGKTSIVLGLVLEGGAFLWIRRLLRVEP